MGYFGIEKEKKSPEDVPQYVIDASPEQMAQDLNDYGRKMQNLEEGDRIFVGVVNDHFWFEKGLENTWHLPIEMRLKVQKSERLADIQINKERKAVYEKEIEDEKKELPVLVPECMQWAYQYGLKKLTLIVNPIVKTTERQS